MAPRQIPVSEIELGMVLASPAMTPDGQVLLREGTVLNERHRTMLAGRSIEQILVESEDEEAPAGAAMELPTPPGEVDPKVRERLEQVFTNVRGDERMETILSLALERSDRINV